jgi:hypothetical protein
MSSEEAHASAPRGPEPLPEPSLQDLDNYVRSVICEKVIGDLQVRPRGSGMTKA